MASTSKATFNFSRPGRASGAKNSISPWSRATNGAASQESNGREAQSQRPAKAQYVQVHVTSDDLAIQHNAQRDMGEHAIPSSTTERLASSLQAIRRKKTETWPPNTRESKSWTLRFEGAPSRIRTRWELNRGRPDSRWSPELKNSLNGTNQRREFVQLPREIYQCIVDHLQAAHNHVDGYDVSHLKADLRSLCLVSKDWHHIAREHLYRDLWLPSNKAPLKRHFSRTRPRSKMKMLLDAMGASLELGNLVRHIRLTSALALELEAEAYVPCRKGSALAALEEVVRQCYHLEQVSGYVLPATTSTLPVIQALGTRTKLRSHTWILNSRKGALPGLEHFVFNHDSWENIETLVLFADTGVDFGPGTLAAVWNKLPALRNLMVSGLHHEDFHDTSLLTLPPVKSLRLESLGGITDQGVEELAFSRLALSLERLTLVDLELLSLQTIQTLLSSLTRLRRFTLVQGKSPELHPAARSTSGALCSPSLTYLHWDCLAPGTALSWLAQAIKADRFPKLRCVKVPCDYEGLIQRLCRPLPFWKLVLEDLEYLRRHTQDFYERNLRVAQIQAQLRVRQSGNHPSSHGIPGMQSTQTMGSCLGSTRSKIVYSLTPDIGDGALAELEDIVRPGSLGNILRLEHKLEASMLF